MQNYQKLILIFTVAAQLSQSKPSTIEVKWTYKNIKNFKMELYEVAPSQPLWRTDSIEFLKDASIGKKIDKNTISVEPNRRYKFALVAKNSTDKPLYFFAAPHTTTPEELSFGLRFKCLCINHAFKIEPQKFWYRIVELRLDPSYKAEKMKITHSIIGVDEKAAQEFQSKMEKPD